MYQSVVKGLTGPAELHSRTAQPNRTAELHSRKARVGAIGTGPVGWVPSLRGVLPFITDSVLPHPAGVRYTETSAREQGAASREILVR
jgi:hypothetical protein